MKRRKHRYTKKASNTAPTAPDPRHPAFGQPLPNEELSKPVPMVANGETQNNLATVGAFPVAQAWVPEGNAVGTMSYKLDTPALHPVPAIPPDRVAIELYVENETSVDIILRHVTAEDISVLVEHSQIEPGKTCRAVMIISKTGESLSRKDGLMFCQGQAKHQCIVRCQGRTLWVALQSGVINPQLHDITEFGRQTFTGRRYLLRFLPHLDS